MVTPEWAVRATGPVRLAWQGGAGAWRDKVRELRVRTPGDRVYLGTGQWWRNLGGADAGVSIRFEGDAVASGLVTPLQMVVSCGIHPGVRYAGTASGYSDDSLAVVPRLHGMDTVDFSADGKALVAHSTISIPAGFILDRQYDRVSWEIIEVSRNADIHVEVYGRILPGVGEAVSTMVVGTTSRFEILHRVVLRVPGPGVELPRRPFPERLPPFRGLLRTPEPKLAAELGREAAGLLVRLWEHAQAGDEAAYEEVHRALTAVAPELAPFLALGDPYG